MTQEEIKKILPHRDNMLLVDEAELCEDEKDEQGQPCLLYTSPSPRDA